MTTSALELVTESLLEKYRDCNVDFNDWWDYVYEGFIDDMKAIGVRVDNIYFSGFWSQGDGACFEGAVQDRELFMKNFEGYPMIRKLVVDGGSVYLSVEHSGHYYHENCTRWNYEWETFEQILPAPTEFHEKVIAIMDEELDTEASAFEEEAIEFMKDKMRELYSRLSDEYDHLTSDEVVAETIVANDWHINDDDNEE
jgi:hypothetical protein